MGTEDPASAAPAASDDASDAAAAAPVVLKVGDTVELHGLKAAPELNGLHGQLSRFDTSTGRWEVKLTDGEVKALKPDNLKWKSMGPIDDDGTLMLAGMASDHPTVQQFTQQLGAELPKVNETLQLINAVIGPTGGAAAKGEEAGIWVKLAYQAEKRVRGAMEDIQKHLEALDSVDMAKCGGNKGANDLRMARKDLVILSQAIQERLEIAMGRLLPVFQRLKAEVPQKKHGWGPDTRDEAPLHEKYREAFASGEEARAEEQRQKAEAADAAAKVGLKPIVVKYQGRGEKPAPSDNLYVKALPGWITEEDVQAMFSPSGVIQSMKLKTAEWGAIAFVRLANKKEAALAIQALDGKIPERLQQRADEQDAQRRKNDGHAAELEAVMDQLERGVLLVFDLARPLGLFFNDSLLVDRVQDSSQAADLGVRRGWQVRAIGGIDVRAAKELVKKIQKLKSKGFTEAALAFSPPPIVVTFTERPFGLAVAKQEDVGLIVVQDVKGLAFDKGVRPGAVLTMVQGTNVSGLGQDEVMDMLKEAVLPAEVAFEQSQAPRGADGKPLVAARASKVTVDLEDSDGEDQQDSRKERQAAEVAKKLVVDLTKPLGIHFDVDLAAKAVQDGSQAAALGVAPGWRVRSIGGVQLQRTEQLVDRIKGLKVQGETSVSIVFSCPAGAVPATVTPAKRPAPEVPASASLPSNVVQVDLSQPLGITFDHELGVSNVADGSQAARLGIGRGWRACLFDGQALRDTPDLVGKIKDAKAHGRTAAAIGFSVPAVEAASVTTTLLVDLAQPLGLHFDSDLGIHGVADGSQAARLGIGKGWRARALGGEPLQTTIELVAKIRELKAKGHATVSVTFEPPADGVPAEEPDLKRKRPRPAKEPQASLAGDASSIAAPADQAVSGGNGSVKELELDLTQSLGMHFGEDLCVESVREGSQAATLNVRCGWRVSAIAGQALNNSAELVTTIEALKAHDVKSVTLSFAEKRPAPAKESPQGKRARTDPAAAASASAEAAAAAAEAAAAGAKAAAAAIAKAAASEAAAAGAKAAAAALAKTAALAKASAAAAAVEASTAAAKSAAGTAQAPAATAAGRPCQQMAAPGPATEVSAPVAPVAPSPAVPAPAPVPATVPESTVRYQLDMDLSKPLGIHFDDALTAKAVQPGSQAAKLGVSQGWSVHAVGDIEKLASTPDLVAAVKGMKAQGMTKARFTFSPGPPVVAAFTERPFGFSPTFSTALRSVVVAHSEDVGPLASNGVRTGSALVSLSDNRDTSQMGLEELTTLLGEVALPVEIGFRETPRFCATMSLAQPLGINFDTELRVKKVMDGTQAATLGVGKGWQVHTLDGKPLSSTPELVAAVKQMKEQGVATMVVDFFPTSEA